LKIRVGYMKPTLLLNFFKFFYFFLVLQCIYSRKWLKNRLFYGGTKVITIFLERHKWHKAAPYVYLVTTKIWGWPWKNCGNYGAMSISEHFWTWQTFLQTARVYLTVFSIYSDQLWYRECRESASRIKGSRIRGWGVANYKMLWRRTTWLGKILWRVGKFLSTMWVRERNCTVRYK